jgi:hypothetical protein
MERTGNDDEDCGAFGHRDSGLLILFIDIHVFDPTGSSLV